MGDHQTAAFSSALSWPDLRKSLTRALVFQTCARKAKYRGTIPYVPWNSKSSLRKLLERESSFRSRYCIAMSIRIAKIISLVSVDAPARLANVESSK